MFLANRILLVGTIVGALAIPSSAQEWHLELIKELTQDRQRALF